MKKYTIIRFYQNGSPSKVIKNGLTLSEAKAHCSRDDTHKPGKWFDGFTDDYVVEDL